MPPARAALLLRQTPSRLAQQTRPFSAAATRHHNTTASSSVNPEEISHFNALASTWWDPHGSSRLLHLMNPLRHDFIRSCHASQPDALPRDTKLRYLDVGCGGGIFAESLARSISTSPASQTATPTRAASITAIDPSTTLIQIARDHARLDPTVDAHLRSGRFEYKNCTLEDLIASQQTPPSTSTPTPAPTPSRENCPADVEELGRATWTFLHTTAAYYPERPTQQQRVYMLSLLRALPVLYPCSWCAQHLGECMKTRPPDVSGRAGLSRWLCEQHNEVNERLGKERFDCSVEKLDERWKDGPADGRCD